ncbi:hypothetical protein [Kosakonia sp. S42]|uniref:hypothetical protein n=1 Tax=Kosakonia sp. S42 TaxID=2767458 RepID=UPI00190B0A85|nr:hypothetical protein [Kosakonia sp. S42]MBK0019116.1 hypothetical protein [Kosakonia sp. S42]
MSGAKILAVLDKDGMRDAQGVNGGKTSPLEPTINGATYKDSELDIVIKAENGLELLKEIEAKIERGIMSKEHLNNVQRPLAELSTNKNPNVLFGNVSSKGNEWEQLFVDLSGYRSEDQVLAHDIIVDSIANPNFVYVKDQGPGKSKQYTPVIGKNSVLAWGVHSDQKTKTHSHIFRHTHTITDKNYEYNPNTGEVIINQVNPDARRITASLSLKDNFVRTQVLKNINDNLKAAGLPLLDNIYLSTGKMLSPEEIKAQEVIDTNNKEYLDDLYTTAREKAKEESIKNQEQIPKEIIEDAVVQNELNEIDALIKQKQKLAAEYAAKAIKENNEIQGFEKAREAVIALHQEKRVNQELSTELNNTKQALEEEAKLRSQFEEKANRTSEELAEKTEAFNALSDEYKALGEQYDDLETTHTTTLEKHREIVERLNEQLVQQDLDHTNEVELLEKNHEAVVNKLNSDNVIEVENLTNAHKQEIETLKTQQASIVSGLNSEITTLNDTVKAITKDRDSLKFDNEQLEIELEKAKKAIIDMERKHKEELEKRDEEKVSFEQTIKDLMDEKIETDKAIKLLTESNKELIKKVDDHINSYKELEVKFKNVETANISLMAENEQLKTDKKALEEAIKKDIEAKNKADNSNKNKPTKK